MADYEELAAQATAVVATWPQDWQDEFEERAAIKEFVADIPRAQAEFEAYQDIRRRMSQAPRMAESGR